MFLRVDPSSGEPLFRQVADEVKRAVATGRLKPGDRLPSVRELARDLLINPNTIARAYLELEGAGVTRSRQGMGTFVAERQITVRGEERRRRCREALEALLADAVHLGLAADEVRRLFEAAMRRFRFDAVEKES